MNYIVQNDLYYLWKEKRSIIFLYFFCFFLFAVLGMTTFSTKKEAFDATLGLVLNGTSSFDLLLYFFHFLFYLVLSYYLILHDLDHGINSIFCRMKARTWVGNKLSSIALVTVFFRTLSFLFLGIFLRFSYSLSAFLVSLFWIFLIQLFFFILELLSQKIKGIAYIGALSLLLFLVFFRRFFLSVYFYEAHVLWLVFGFLLELVFLLFLVRKNRSLLLERGN